MFLLNYDDAKKQSFRYIILRTPPNTSLKCGALSNTLLEWIYVNWTFAGRRSLLGPQDSFIVENSRAELFSIKPARNYTIKG